MPMMYGYGYEWSWGAALFMVLNMILWVALIGVVIWSIVRWTSRRGPADDDKAGPSARDILQQRYSRGELDTETCQHPTAKAGGLHLPRER
jgi:putative membrane protein